MMQIKYPHRCEILTCSMRKGIKVCCNFCQNNKTCPSVCFNDHNVCKKYYVLGENTFKRE